MRNGCGNGATTQNTALALSPTADDESIWAHAVSTAAIVITKDTDYLDLAARVGGAAVVLVRCGNLRLATFRAWFDARWPAAEALIGLGENVIELR